MITLDRALRQTFLQASRNRQLEGLAMRRGAFRRLALRFVAGEMLEDALGVARELNRRGLKVSIDHLGENVGQPEEARAAAETYVQAIEAIGRQGLDANVSLKLTQMGLDLSEELCLDNVRRILDCAAAGGNFARLDMESSAYTERTLRVFRKLWRTHHNVGVVIQAYLYRSHADVEELNALGARVRLCKGAYNEPPNVAFPRKEDVDANYAELAERLLLHGTYPGFATHDERLIEHIRAYAFRHDVPHPRYEFQMLFGIRRDLQERLGGQGHPVRVYVPYGPEWYPYLMRRLAERPANVLFVIRSLLAESKGEAPPSGPPPGRKAKGEEGPPGK